MVKLKPTDSDQLEPSPIRDESLAPLNQDQFAQSPHKQARKNKVRSAFTYSLIAFTAINVALACTQFFKVNPDNSSYHGWSWWTVHDIRQATVPSNVVLLGSSLMVAAIAECDANFLKHTLDLATYRGASYVDKVLQDRFQGSFNTLNLSAPGQMPSDAYLTLRAAVDEGVKPSVLVYGVAPRDFLDGTMQSPSDTEAFKFLHRSVDISDCGLDYYASPFGKLDWLLQRSFNLYRLSSDCRLSMERWCRLYLSHNGLFNLPEYEGEAGPFASRLRAINHPFNIEPGTFLALQTIKDKSAMIDNRRDYMDRYRNPDQRLYETQFRFLERITKLCAKEGITLIIVEMPITLENVQLLKPALYSKYKADLAHLCAKGKIRLLDLCQFKKYTRDDYRDTVHLNGYGGKKFVDSLVFALGTDDQIKKTLVETSQQSPAGAK